MNIATSLNKKYVPYTGVMLYSLGCNNKEHIDVYVLNSELDEEDMRQLRECVASFDMNLIDMKVDEKLFHEQMPRTEQWTIEAYYRLLLVDLLPENVERILYLDVDMIVNLSLKELYEVDFCEDELIACADVCGVDYHKYLNQKQQDMFASMLANGYQYFNSGFLLMNMKEMRKTYSFAYYVNVMENDWHYEMHAPDQDILNYVHGPKTGYVDWGQFNVFARVAHQYGITYDDVKKGAAIIHFAGEKPWNTTYYHFDIETIWWEYAKQTTFYPWLLEHFMLDSMSDHLLEMRIDRLKSQCNRLIELNNKLM